MSDPGTPWQDPREAYYAGRRDERNEIIRDLHMYPPSGGVLPGSAYETPRGGGYANGEPAYGGVYVPPTVPGEQTPPRSFADAWKSDEKRRHKEEHKRARENALSVLYGVGMVVLVGICLIVALHTGFKPTSPW